MGTNRINQISNTSITNVAKMFGIDKIQVSDLFLELKNESMIIIEKQNSNGD